MKYFSPKKGFVWLAPLVIGAAAVLIGALLGIHAANKTVSSPTAPLSVGSTLPTSIPSVFETYLSSQMGQTDTSMTLANGLLRDGTTLTGYQCFTIDANSPSLEYVCGTASSTSAGTITSLVRGIDAVSGTTSISSLAFTHRVGADVKISDYPILTILTRQANGLDTYPNPIAYTSTVGTSSLQANAQNLATVGYVNNTAFSGAGVVNATAGAKGIVQIATAGQAAGGTVLGSTGAFLSLTSQFSSSTASTTSSIAIISSSTLSGRIDPSFVSNGSYSNVTITSTSTLPANTLINGSSAFLIGKNFVVASTTGTSTYTFPSGITQFTAIVIGGGGGGINAPTGSIGSTGGGSAAGCAYASVSLTGTTTISLTIGAAGTSTSSGNASSLNWYTGTSTLTGTTTITANGGNLGTVLTTNGVGALGGTATGGYMNMTGADGDNGYAVTGTAFGGHGGSSCLGGGGRGAVSTVSQNVVPSNGGSFGAGAGGGAAYTNGAATGGAIGGGGAIILSY